MKNIVLLDTLTFGEDISLSAFDTLGTVTTYARTQAKETLERIRHAHVIVTNKVVITQAMMQEALNLELICVAATGMNNVDLNAAQELGISIKNVVGYSTNSVVQLTFSMALYLLDHARYYDEYVQSKAWSQSGLFTHVGAPFFEIAGKKWGIIGLGTIGKEVAKVATAFGAKVCYYSTSGKNTQSEYERLSLNDLLLQSDIISIHAPLNEHTKDLLTKKNLVLLKKDALLLNLGRGGIINEQDLALAIDELPIYVGLDVLEKEPIDADHPLLKCGRSRLYITPHIAWTSVEARMRLIGSTVENIRTHYGT